MSTISVIVHSQGKVIPVVGLSTGATIAQALEKIGVSLNGREIRVNGNQVDVSYALQNSDIVLMTDKIKGNEITNI